MFKVSFKDSPKNSYRTIIKKGAVTSVHIIGTIKLPDFWKHIPEKIMQWMENQHKVGCYENIASNTLIITSLGDARCHPEDKYNTIIGERLAESRAKQNIYYFLYSLTNYLLYYYQDILGTPIDWNCDSTEGICGACAKYEKLFNHELEHQQEILKSASHE